MTCFDCKTEITENEISVMIFGQVRHYDAFCSYRHNDDALARILGSDDRQYELFAKDGFIWSRNGDGKESETAVKVDAGETAVSAILASWGPEGYQHPFNLRMIDRA